MGNPLPITSKLLPRQGNWFYLAEVAVLSRVATGIMRVLENRPSKQKDPRLSKNEKRQALVERFFVEIVGTAGYMAFLHLGQDLVNKLYNPKIPQIKLSGKPLSQELSQTLSDLGLCVDKFDKHINECLRDVYAPHDKLGTSHAKNLIYRVLYGDPKTGMANMEALKNKLAELPEVKLQNLSQNHLDTAFNKIVNEVTPLKQFAMRNNVWGSMAILLGVSLSAMIGGSVIQKLCDGPVASTAKQWLRDNYQNDSHPDSHHPLQPQPEQTQLGIAEPVKLPQSLSIVSEAPPLLPVFQSQPPPLSPVYLPNPKQPTATPFPTNTLSFPYYTKPFSTSGGRL